MGGRFSIPIIAIWLVFLAYCSSGVLYARDLVRSVLKETPPRWTIFSLPMVLIVALVLILNAVTRLSIVALAIALPLTVHRILILPLIHRKASSKIERIRMVGFSQAGNLLTASLILALVSRL
jgi:hypothetical protein